jgi:hypothetical protein
MSGFLSIVHSLSGGHDFETRDNRANNIDPACKMYDCKLCCLTVHIYDDLAVGVFLKNEKLSKKYNYTKINELPNCNELVIKNLLE